MGFCPQLAGGAGEKIHALEKVIVAPLSPVSGHPNCVFIGEGCDRPTLLVGNQAVPAMLSADGGC